MNNIIRKVLCFIVVFFIVFTKQNILAENNMELLKPNLNYSEKSLVTSLLINPNYKGLIYKENGEDDICLEIHMDYEALSDEKIMLSVYLTDKNNNIIYDSYSTNIEPTMHVSFSSGTLPLGDYYVNVAVVNTLSGEILDKDVHIVRKRSGSFDEHSLYVNDNGILIKNGLPYFYIGMYGANYNFENLNYLQLENVGSDAGIDGFLSYWQGMNGTYSKEWYDALACNGLANIANMRVFYEKSDDRINFKLNSTEDEAIRLADWTCSQSSYPSLALYYVGDEEAPEYNDKIKWHSGIISHYDLMRPTLFIDWRAQSSNGFLRSSASDIVGIDYYPLIDNVGNIGAVGSRLRSFASGVKNRPVFMVLQCANYDAIYGNFNHDKSKILPTYTHLMNMAMQSVCSGAKGIMWYSYYRLMNDLSYTDVEKSEVLNSVKSVSKTLKEYADIILSSNEVPEVISTQSNGEAYEYYTVRRYDGKTYIFVVNTSSDAKQIDFSLSEIESYKNLFSSNDVAISTFGDSLSVTLSGLGYAIVEVEHAEFKSSDCSIHSLSLYDGNDSIIYSVDDEGNIQANVSSNTRNLTYSMELADGASLLLDGKQAQCHGKIDNCESQITIVAADGTTKNIALVYSYKDKAAYGKLQHLINNDGSITVSGCIYGRGTMFVAAYDQNNCLATIYRKELDYGIEDIVSLSSQEADNKIVKAFLWKNDMEPIDFITVK